MLVPEGRPRSRGRLALLSLAVLLLTISIAIDVSGGFQTTVMGARVSARSPVTAAVAAAVVLLVWLVRARSAQAVADDLARVFVWIEAHAPAIVVVVAAVSGAIAVRFATFSAAGSDASGYLSQAAMLARGHVTHIEPIAAIATWPDGPATVAPLGWRAAAGTTQVPTYAVGLPLLMAIPHVLGGALAASLVVSAGAALAVWFAGRLAMLVAGGAAGVLSAVWLATMPVHVFESIQPMSDVPVTAAWLACWWYVAKTAEKGTVPFMAVFAGVAAMVAILIRPNLAPLAAIPLLFLVLRARGARTKVAFSFAAPVAAAGLTVAFLQWRYFGSPFRSGYGSATEIYALSTVVPNISLYFEWLVDSHGPWLLFAPLVLIVNRAAILRWLVAFAAAVCVAYFVYSIFEHWSYLRFLLPAMAIAAIAVSVLIVSTIRRLPVLAQLPVLIAIVIAIAASQVASARELGVFRLAARQSHVLLAGRYLESALRPNAVVISGEQSGAWRYYTGRPILRWDSLAPDDLPRALEPLSAAGVDVWVALDDWEVPKYREKFSVAVSGGLDWPPVVDTGTEGRTQAWRVRDRAPFLTGARAVTDRLR
jgi:hypothetical protein